MNDERYPTGRFTPKRAPLTEDERTARLGMIAALPGEARAAVSGLGDAELDTPYREGGWSPRQIIHHLPDSHLNAFVRFKLALSEDVPTIKPYDQAAWARMADAALPIPASLAILDGLHERWVGLMESMGPEDFARRLLHPEVGEIDLDYLLELYAWHGHHHVTQIVDLKQRMGWG